MAAGLIAALATAGCGGASDRPAASAPQPSAPNPPRAAEPSPAQRVGQALILSFEGTTVPPYVERALREGRAAGVILFGGNIVSAGQLRRLTAALQRAAGGSALIMVDQEGGPVRVVPFAAPSSGQAAQSTDADARAQARATGRDLRRLGVNVDLAPVADVPSVPGAVLAGRAFTGDAGTVASRVRAAVDAYVQARVGATAKHFPGLGAATANTDDAAVTVPGPTEADLQPFRSAIEADVQLVMASHALYPALDRARIASQSKRILGDLLRGRLAFEGTVVTDSMEARAVIARSSLTVAAERSLLAGADLLLLTGDGSFRPVSRHLLTLARRSPEARNRLAEANGRVAQLRRRLGLRPAPVGP